MKLNWPTKKLGEDCQVIMGQSPPSTTYNEHGEGLPFYQGKKDFGEVYPVPNVWCSESIKIVERNDILISVRAPVGALNIAGEKSCIGRGLAGIRTGKLINYQYLYFFLQSRQSEIASWGTGSTFAAISKIHLVNIEIPLPPLEIQKKIVKKIEVLFAKIAQAQSLREAAIQDADDLIPATLSKIFEEGRSKGWKGKKLSEVIKIIGGGTPSKNNFSYYKGDIPWATVRDLKNDYVEATEFKISEKAVKESSTSIIPANNVILVTRVGLGKMSIITRDTAINQDLKALIPRDEGSLDKKFLFWWLKTQMKFIQSQGRGATVMGVRLELINNLKIPLPPLAEQKKIVVQLDVLTQKVRELQTLQSQTASDLTTLKQSILHQAFQGKLVN